MFLHIKKKYVKIRAVFNNIYKQISLYYPEYFFKHDSRQITP